MKPFDIPTRAFEEVILKVATQAVRHTVDIGPFSFLSENLRMNKLDLALTSLGQRMVLELEHFIAAQQLENLVIKTPANWWEHLKEEKLAQWKLTRRYVKKHPVKYREQRFDLQVFYPQVQLPRERHYFVVTKLNES